MLYLIHHFNKYIDGFYNVLSFYQLVKVYKLNWSVRFIQLSLKYFKIIKMSSILQEVDVLLALGSASKQDRRRLIENMPASMMKCVETIITKLLLDQIPVFQRDVRYFRRYSNTLRMLTSERVSMRRKKRILHIHYAILSRVLRPSYIQHALVSELRANEH